MPLITCTWQPFNKDAPPDILQWSSLVHALGVISQANCAAFAPVWCHQFQLQIWLQCYQGVLGNFLRWQGQSWPMYLRSAIQQTSMAINVLVVALTWSSLRDRILFCACLIFMKLVIIPVFSDWFMCSKLPHSIFVLLPKMVLLGTTKRPLILSPLFSSQVLYLWYPFPILIRNGRECTFQVCKLKLYLQHLYVPL